MIDTERYWSESGETNENERTLNPIKKSKNKQKHETNYILKVSHILSLRIYMYAEIRLKPNQIRLENRKISTTLRKKKYILASASFFVIVISIVSSSSSHNIRYVHMVWYVPPGRRRRRRRWGKKCISLFPLRIRIRKEEKNETKTTDPSFRFIYAYTVSYIRFHSHPTYREEQMTDQISTTVKMIFIS